MINDLLLIYIITYKVLQNTYKIEIFLIFFHEIENNFVALVYKICAIAFATILNHGVCVKYTCWLELKK